MLYNHYYDVNDICEDNDNYNNINNYSIKPFASKKEYFDDDRFSLFKASRISHFKKSNFWAIMGEEEGQFQAEEVEEENETPENPFTPSYSDFEPSPLPNFRNLEIIPQQPPKQENIIQYDRNTITDRIPLTEMPIIHFNRDFQPLHLPNLNNSEVLPQQQPKRENNITYERNRTTDRTKTQQMDQTKKVIKEKIFNIKKVKRNMGAKPKGYVNISGKKMHTRNADDNILTKIRRALNNHSVKYVNKRLKKSDNPVLKSLSLKKVQNSVILVHKKEDNLKFLEMNLEELFSNPISAKFKNDKKDHNINTIEKILKVGDKEINDILKTDIETILNVYNHKIKNKLFEDFPTIDDDIAEFKDDGLDDNYIKKYIYDAEHFKEKIEKIFPRKRRKKI